MDDSLFLPKDILELKNQEKSFDALRKSIMDLGNVVNHTLEYNSLSSFKEFEKDLLKKLNNLEKSLDLGKAPKDTDVEFYSSITIPVGNLLEEVHSLLTHKLADSTLCFDKRYYFGASKNLSRYIVSSFNLSSDDIERLESQGKFFIFDKKDKELFLFEKPMLHTVLKHLLYEGEDVDLFLILKKLETFLK